MDGKSKYLLASTSLLFIIALVSFASESTSTTFAAVTSNKQGTANAAGPALAPTDQYSIYLPFVTRDYCTPASIKLSGVVFFDYNGDGSQQPNEPGITGASVSLGSQSTSSQSGGYYQFCNLPDGSYNVVVTASDFWYFALSKSEFKAIGNSITVLVNGSTQRNIGLMQGFLTLPYNRSTNYSVQEYFDYDPTYYKYLWWNNQSGDGVWRNHTGTNIGVSANGIPVVASAPGQVTGISTDPNSGSCVSFDSSVELSWGLCHITPTVSLQQSVSRGDLIGYVNYPGVPHVHMGIGYLQPDGYYFRDMFVPLNSSICAEWKWAPNNDPIYVKTSCSPGYWTVKNNPQSFD